MTKIMSKEQTPIEEVIELIMTDPTATIGAKELCEFVLSNYLQKEKEFIQAKVLEALERDKEKSILAITNWCVDAYNQPDEYSYAETFDNAEEYALDSVKTFLEYLDELSKQK